MRGALGVLCAVAVCAAAVPAGAATKGVVVARLPSGATLRAYDGSAGPCVSVRASRTTSDDCVGRVPRYAPQARLGITGGEGGTIGFGVVPADVTAGDVELPDGQRVRADTFAGEAYHGRAAGRVRFALIELPDASSPGDLVRFLDAAGNVIGARDTGPLSGPITVPARTFAHTSRGTVV